MMSKARVQKRLYHKIGEACKALGIQPYVLRYWETEFPALAPSKSRSGQRVYSEKEMEIIRRIKELLYEEGYTIAGAKKKLEAELAAGGVGEAVAVEDDAQEPAEAPPPAKKASRKAAPPPPEPQAAMVSEERSSLDTEGSERVQRLLSGIDEALGEARELLALLGSKQP
ncbi:MAG TPA: MerR family transcriptional regulator [Thermoanaerobaculia bacterium]